MTSLRDLLAADRDAFERSVAALAGSRALPDLPDLPGRRGVGAAVQARALMEQVGTELRGKELKDIVVGAWRLRSELREAARETARRPGTYRQVALRSYHVPWEHEMDMDVLVDGQKVGSLTVTVSVDVTVTALSAMIRGGRLTALHSGDGDVMAELIVSTPPRPLRVTVPLARARQQFDLGVEVPVPGGGIRLDSGAG